MLRRSLFVSALMLSGVVGFGSSAKAGTADVTFPATVETFCTLSNPVPGELGVNTNSTGLGTDATTYNRSGTATVGKIDLDCSKDTIFSVAVTDSGNPTTAATTTAMLKTSDGNATDTTDLTLGANIAETAEVEMTATAPANEKFIPGDYLYTVTITSTP